MSQKLYLLKFQGIPIKIFENEERVTAILEYTGNNFDYRSILHWEAHLLQPNIKDYHFSQAKYSAA